MISRLQQGTCDAIVINVENAQGYLASNPNFRLVTFDEGSGFTLPAKGSCVGLRKSDNELLDQINTILPASTTTPAPPCGRQPSTASPSNIPRTAAAFFTRRRVREAL